MLVSYITGPSTISWAEEPEPIPAPGDVLVRVSHTALSPGSNLHAYLTGSYGAAWSPGERVAPLYMGSGTVIGVGEGVSPDRIGEPVAFQGNGHQAQVAMAAERAYPVPAGVDLAVASLAYLSAWSVSALHLGEYAAAERVVVVGLGLVGASVALVADAMGAWVLGIDAQAERVALGQRLPIGRVADAHAVEEMDAGRAWLGETGADLIIDTTGSWSGFRTALSLARDYSRIALMGIVREPPPPDLAAELHGDLFGFPSPFHYRRIKVVGCGSDPVSIGEPMPRMATRAGNFRWVLEQMGRGRLDLAPLLTARHPASAIEPVLQELAAGTRSQLGIVFDWEASA
jgi:threonine dehydrogenase-like Zn-dependent dehydrogenase